ncbi:MAG: carbohydrate ABC transporter permease, partial [Firmicutes bacterium]|nr:carbohydrate ABC transporter permease [Bacillota bacterium]
MILLKVRKKLPRVMVNFVVIAAIAIWFLPTFGLLVTSFRPASDVAYSGWWTALSSPLKFTQYTVENYQNVLSSGGMLTAFRNSFII